MLLETNFLPWVAAVRGSRHSGTTFTRDISLKHLDRVPVVIGVRRFLEVANPSEIYGPRLEQRIPFQADRVLPAAAQAQGRLPDQHGRQGLRARPGGPATPGPTSRP